MMSARLRTDNPLVSLATGLMEQPYWYPSTSV